MARGIIFGLVVALLGLATASLVLGPVRMEAPMEAAPEAAAPEAVAPVTPEAPEAESVEPEAEMPEAEAPEAEETEAPAEPEPVAAEEPAEEEAASPEPAAESAAEPAQEEPASEEAMPASEPEAAMPEAPATPESAEPEAAAPEAAEPSEDMTGGGPVAEPAALPEAADRLEEGEEPASGVVTGRLPSIGDAAEPEAETEGRLAPTAPLAPAPESAAAGVVTGRLPTIGEVPEAEAEVTVETGPALERNALPFAATEGQPLLSLLLLDTGGDRSALGNLPFPVTVAVDASAPDAAEAVAFYREQGAEVVVVVPLPEGATPVDVDVTVEAYSALLKGAVAVMAEPEADFQTMGAAAEQLATNLAETGHGLVSFPAGLNTGHKAALKEGVAAGLVFRDLDGKGQEGPVIRRFLDNAAFRAGSENGVIVLARTKPETLQALLEWSLGTRAQTVTLAPVSAVLRAK